MARLLGLAQFGSNAADSALRTYGFIKGVQRLDAKDKRDQEEFNLKKPVLQEQAAEAQDKLDTLNITKGARTLAQQAAQEYDTTYGPRPKMLSALPDGQSPDGLVESGNIDIANRPVLHNPDGSISTVRSITITNDKGQGILLPTVGPNGEDWSSQQAIDAYKKTGKNLGVFSSEKQADAYAQNLHQQQAKMYLNPDGSAPTQGPPPSKDFYVAHKVADYYRSQGRPEDATKTLTKAYTDAIAANEAKFNFELQPRMQKFKEMNLSGDELKTNKEYQDLRWQMYQTQLHNLGSIYGIWKAGDKTSAIQAFNNSGITAPGTSVSDVRIVEGKDGTPMMVAYDKTGNVARDQNGSPIAMPQSLLERTLRIANTQDLKLGSKDRLVRVTKEPDGTTSASTVIPAQPDEAAADRATNRAVTLRKQARDEVGKQLFQGQTMMDKVDPVKQKIHGIAAPIAERYVDQGMKPGAAAARAIKDAEDQIKRDNTGPKGQEGGAPQQGGMSWRDLLGGGPSSAAPPKQEVAGRIR